MQPEQDQPSTIAAYALAIADALGQYGIEPESVFTDCELELPSVTDPLRRLNNQQVGRLFAAAVARTDDPAFGLKAGQSMRPGNLHALGYALLSSSTLRDFCNRLANYYRIVSQNAVIHVEESPAEFVLVTQAPAPDLCWETHDAFAALIVNLVRFIYSSAFNPLQLELVRPDPHPERAAYERYFRCPIQYGCQELRFHFDRREVDQQLPGASRELALMHDQTVSQYLEKIDKANIVNRVRSIVVEELASHALTKQLVAERVCMSPRSLQMKLAAEGSSFQEILDSTRRALAISYMEQASVSITEAAYLVGFTEVSNFTRAFRRWTGQSPREFRRNLGID